MGSIGTGLMVVFIVGLAQSISTGFAGGWGGLPFTLITLFVIVPALAAKGIVVTNTPDVLTDATTEIAMLLMLGAA